MIGEFLERYPAVQLELLPTDRVVDMIEEGIDVAIRIGKLADTSFMARKIGEDIRLICASPSYLAAPPRAATARGSGAAQLHRQPRAAGSQPLAVPCRRPRRNQIREIEVGGRIAVTEGEAQMRLALRGLGIVRLTRLTVAQRHPRGELVSLLARFLRR